MQLDSDPRPTALRQKLAGAAVAALLLEPALAHAQSAPTTQLDFTGLLYGEQNRAQIVEPFVKVTRLFPDGQSLSAQFGLDVITGASASGALPSGIIQTSTTPSGNTVTLPPGQIPTTTFNDQRFGFDVDWKKPLSRYFTSDIGTHFSKERDYRSFGINGKFSVDLMHRLITLTAGGGVNFDGVFPRGGTPAGLSDGTIVFNGTNSKTVKTLLFGVSKVMTRRWLLAFDGSKTYESGYLTEPYKVISVVDPVSGIPLQELTDKRPSTRDRTSLLFTSVYHLTNDVLYLSYRHYWDTWDVRSNTYDFKFRHDLGDQKYFEPHVRYYQQTAANFFTIGLVDGEPLPDFATADSRLGPLKSITLGGTFGLRLGDYPGEWTVRAEYIRQTGDSFPAAAVGLQKQFNLSPPMNTAAVVIGYSVNF